MSSSTPRIVYIPRPDATLENEIAVLADVYSFVLRCAEERKADLAHSKGNISSLDEKKKGGSYVKH